MNRSRRTPLVLALSVGLLGSLAQAQILKINNESLSDYLGASATGVEGLWPQANQRATYIDGSLRAGTAMGVSIAANPGGDLGFNRRGIVDGVDLFHGAYMHQPVDISLPAPGDGQWPIARMYSARQYDLTGPAYHTNSGTMGHNWSTSTPSILLYTHISDDTKDQVIVVFGPDRYSTFVRTSSGSNNFRGVNGAGGAIVFNDNSTDPDTFTLHDMNGTMFTFFGFDGASSPAQGQFWKKEDADGNVAYIGHATNSGTAISSGYDGSGRVLLAYDASGRQYDYDYNGDDLLSKVEVKTWSGSAWVTTGHKVEYTYYTSTINDQGVDGDLRSVTVTTPMSDSTAGEATTLYHYYTGAYHATTNPGHPHSIRMIVDAAGYAKREAADGNSANDTPFSDDEAALKPYSSAYFKYDDDRRIVQAFFNGECGCSGPVTGETNYSYEEPGSFTNSAGYDDEWALKVIKENHDGTVDVYLFDETGQVIALIKADDDLGASPDHWVTSLVRDGTGGWITEIRTPENLDTYDNSTTDITPEGAAGLITVVSRIGSGPATEGFVEFLTHKKGTGGTEHYDAKMEYTVVANEVGDTVAPDLYEYSRAFVSARRQYHINDVVAASKDTAANYRQTSMAYTFWGNKSTDQALVPKTIISTNPTVTTAENGSNSATTSTLFLRKDRTTAFRLGAGGRYDYTKYAGGLLTLSIQDVKTNDSTDIAGADDPSGTYGITETGDGWHRETSYVYDGMGRPTSVTAPDGDISVTHYTILADQRRVTVRFPLYEATPTYYGPASYTVSNLAGRTEFAGSIIFSGGSTSSSPASLIDETDTDPILAVTGGASSLFGVSTTLYNETGTRVNETRSYFDIPASGAGSKGSNYDRVAYTYDDDGRRIRVVDQTDTITRTNYDALGRVSSTEIGTDDTGDTGSTMSGSNNMVVTAEVVYDGGGVGNGKVTRQTRFVQDSSTGQRITNFGHDLRGRVILTESPTSPHSLVARDNVGRVVASALYSSVSGLSASSDPLSVTTNRLALTETAFDALGRAFKTTTHAIASNGTSTDSLVSEQWYDADGRVVKSIGQIAQKFAYDRADRRTHEFTMGSITDADYAAADDVAGDIVVLEQQTVYESALSDNVVMAVAISREHDDLDNGTTGALDANADGGTPNPLILTAADNAGRDQITGIFYDDLDRPVTTVNYGTFGGSTFNRGSMSEPSASSATELVTKTSYGDNGLPASRTNENGRETRYSYDDAGRLVAQIDNYINGSPSSATGDDDITTRFAFANGLKTYMWLDVQGDDTSGAAPVGGAKQSPADDADQVTAYIYGVTKGAGAADSKISHNGLLYRTRYPDASEGTSTDLVSHAYNAQGEMLYMKDQNGTVHEYTLDDAGRRTSDKVTAFGANIDQGVKRIDTAFDSLGQVTTITSYSTTDTSGPVNQVQYTYANDWKLISKLQMDPDSIVGASGIAAYEVSYTYAKSTGCARLVRRSTATLPSGAVLTYEYLDTSNRFDGKLGRVTQVKHGITVVATYEYLGLNQLVKTTYPEPGVYSMVAAGSGSYPGLDLFNRPVVSSWTKDLSTDVDFYRTEITYGRTPVSTFIEAGLISRIEDQVHSGFDVEYNYDGQDRLTKAEEGTYSSGITSRTRQEDWTFNQAGTFAFNNLDLTGDNDWSDSNEFKSTNTFNNANEWTDRDLDTNNTAGFEAQYDLGYDDAGNLTSDDTTALSSYRYDYVYTAWNQLKEVKTQAGTTVALYGYYGNRWRSDFRTDTDSDGDSDGSDKTFHNAYDENWRLLAITREDDTFVKVEFTNHQDGLAGMGTSSYINRVICRERDTTDVWADETDTAPDERHYLCENWRGDISAIVTDGGAMVEWAKYSANGVPFGLCAGDADSNGIMNANDGIIINNWISAPSYDVRGDLDLSGALNITDLVLLNNTGWPTLGRGVLSRDDYSDNRKGYAGYEYEPALEGEMWLARNRDYNSGLGVWMTRDPLEYVDGHSLYTYVAGSPLHQSDPLGLSMRAMNSGFVEGEAPQTPWPPINTPGKPYILPPKGNPPWPFGKPPFAPGTIVPKRPPGLPPGVPTAPPNQPHAVCEDIAAANACIAKCAAQIEQMIQDEFKGCGLFVETGRNVCYSLCPAPGNWGSSLCRLQCDAIASGGHAACWAQLKFRRAQQITGALQGMCEAECHSRHQYIVFGMDCPPGWKTINPYIGPIPTTPIQPTTGSNGSNNASRPSSSPSCAFQGGCSNSN